MAVTSLYQLVASLLLLLLFSSAADALVTDKRASANPLAPYAPTPGTCPATNLVRAANGVGSQESAWFSKRKPIADQALQTWLSKFGSFPASSMPTIGSAVAGGFLRASLLGAGIHQQLDGAEGTGPMSGLLQAISYETTLSGSTAYQAGLIQNNWPSIASLSSGLWQPNFAYGMKPGAASNNAAGADAQIVADVTAKSAASYPATLIDIYGRIIGWSNLYPKDGGVSTLMSDARSQSKFANGQVPMPIFTSIGVQETGYTCVPATNGTQYEITPFEFGSWDSGVAAFMDMKYLGTRMLAGKPATPICTTGFDNLGFMVATSANTLSYNCVALKPGAINNPLNVTAGGAGNPVYDAVGTIAGAITAPINRNFYSAITNPFFGSSASPLVSSQPELSLVDGGNSGQVIPLWPLLHRNIDVTFVWDNYYDLGNVGTTGQQIYNTYLAAQAAGIKTMPQIPPASTFQYYGLNTRPTAFGCNDPNVQTYIYVPYQAYIPQTQATNNLTTTPQQTRDYVTDGNLLATNNGNGGWPQCVACLIMKKRATSLPDFCTQCFSTYCAN